MIRVVQNQIEPVAHLLTECFIDDPLVVEQIKGILNKEVFLEKLFLLQLEVFEKTRDVFLLDDKFKSVIIGYEKKKLKRFKQLILSIKSSFKLRNLISKNDIKLYSNNVKAASKIIDLNWQKEFTTKNYYHINVIAVAEEERGKGNLRALITPIVTYCNENNIPIVLETVNSKQIAMYEHSGFNLIKTMSESSIGLNQYCFIKYPNS